MVPDHPVFQEALTFCTNVGRRGDPKMERDPVLDHIVLACRSLKEGIKKLNEVASVSDLPFGGRHRRGTANQVKHMTCVVSQKQRVKCYVMQQFFVAILVIVHFITEVFVQNFVGNAIGSNIRGMCVPGGHIF